MDKIREVNRDEATYAVLVWDQTGLAMIASYHDNQFEAHRRRRAVVDGTHFTAKVVPIDSEDLHVHEDSDELEWILY